MPRAARRDRARTAAAQAEAPSGAAADAPGLPGRIGQALGVLALALLPIAGGGYSGWGYQLGMVLLPLAAALCVLEPRLRLTSGTLLRMLALALAPAVGHLLGMLGGGPWGHSAQVLYLYLLAVPCGWLVARSLRYAPGPLAPLLLPLLALTAVFTAAGGLFLLLGHYLNHGELNYYVTGGFHLHNAYGGYLLLAAPLAAVAALLDPPGLRRGLLWGATALLAATLVLTYSKASIAVLIGQLLCVGGFLLWRRLRPSAPSAEPTGMRAGWRSWMPLGVVAALGLSLLALPTVRHALSQLTDFGGYSMQGRLRFWDAALRMFADAPLGHGLGRFGAVYPQYQTDWRYYSVDPHSWPLQLLAELGIPGLLLALALLAGFALWVRATWRNPHLPALVRLLLILGAGGSLAHAAFDFDYTFLATTALLGVVLARGSAQPAQAAAAASAEAPSSAPAGQLRWLAAALAVLLCAQAASGQRLAAERFVLDALRTPQLPAQLREGLLAQALAYAPGNPATRLQLAGLIAAREGRGSEAALAQVRAVPEHERNADARALLGGLSRDPAQTRAHFESALALDPYNHPEYYFAWAALLSDPDERREVLELGLKRIPITEPVTPDHVRGPDWHKLNGMWADWYRLLGGITDDEAQARAYERRAKAFADYASQQSAAASPAQR